MSDQEFDDLVKQVQAAEIEITRCDATIRALWTELRRLARPGVAASTEYQHLIEVESERERWISVRERIRATLASASRPGRYRPDGSGRADMPRGYISCAPRQGLAPDRCCETRAVSGTGLLCLSDVKVRSFSLIRQYTFLDRSEAGLDVGNGRREMHDISRFTM